MKYVYILYVFFNKIYKILFNYDYGMTFGILKNEEEGMNYVSSWIFKNKTSLWMKQLIFDRKA